MLRWIRPGGVIGLVVFLILVFGTWYLLSGWLLKTTIEAMGTKVVGAKVQVDSADLTLMPLGFRLRRLQVTNPDKPMQNMVEIGSAVGSIEPWRLLLGYVIIDDMSVNDIRFDTPRSTSGALHPAAPPAVQARKEGPAANPLGILKKKLPTADEILKRAQLITPQRVKDLEEAEKTQRAQVEQALKALPDQQRLDQIKAQVHDLTSGKIQSLSDLQQRQRQLDGLKRQIQQLRSTVDTARRQIEAAGQTLTAKFDALQKAPQEDLRRIEHQYGINATGAGNVTRLLFGDEAQKWFDLIRTWYGRIARFLPSGSTAPQPTAPPRGKGHYVHFHEAHPLPTFLIRRAGATAVAPIGSLTATLQDITPQPQILGRPARLQATGKDLHNVKAARFTGVFDHVDPRHARDHVDWHIADWGFTDAHVVKSDALVATLAKALANVEGSADLIGGSLDATMKAAFHDAQWQTSAKQDWAARLLSALSNITSFDVTGKMRGALQAPSLSLQSDLDQKLGKAVVAQVKTQASALEQKLQARLTAQVTQAAGPYRDAIKLIADRKGTANARSAQLDDLLKAKLQSQAKSQENKLKNKLEEQLQKKLGF